MTDPLVEALLQIAKLQVQINELRAQIRQLKRRIQGTGETAYEHNDMKIV